MNTSTDDGGREGRGPRGLRRWLLSATIVSAGADRPFAGGILWMNWQRRGDFQELLRAIDAHAGPDANASASRRPRPFSWSRLSPADLPRILLLVDQFFATPWLSFDAFVVKPGHPEGPVAAEPDAADVQRAVRDQQRSLCDFLAGRIEDRLRAEPDEPQPFRIWIDARGLGYRGRRAAIDEVEQRALRSAFGTLRPCDMVMNHRLASTPALQLADVLTHAVLAGWQGAALANPRRPLLDRIAFHLGWKDLRTVSRPDDTKFNVQPGRPRERVVMPAQLGLFDQPRSSRRPTRPS